MRGGTLVALLALSLTIPLLPGAAADLAGTPADDCEGFVAVCIWRSAFGEEVAVSGTGYAYAENGLLAASGTKDSGPQGQFDYPAVGVSGTGSTKGAFAVSGTGPAQGGFAAASGDGDASALGVAASGGGNATSGGVAVAGLGDAHAYYVAVSGNGRADCDATPCIAFDIKPHRDGVELLP